MDAREKLRRNGMAMWARQPRIDSATLELLRSYSCRYPLTIAQGTYKGGCAASADTHKTRDMGVWDE